MWFKSALKSSCNWLLNALSDTPSDDKKKRKNKSNKKIIVAKNEPTIVNNITNIYYGSPPPSENKLLGNKRVYSDVNSEAESQSLTSPPAKRKISTVSPISCDEIGLDSPHLDQFDDGRQ